MKDEEEEKKNKFSRTWARFESEVEQPSTFWDMRAQDLETITYRPTRKGFGRSIKGLKGAKGFLGQSSVIALCDTGADDNFISEKTAKRLGLHIHKLHGNDRLSFIQGNGAPIHAIGRISTTWSFQTDHGCPPTDIVFNVLKNCIFDIMIGSRFLEQTGTMNEHQERLCPMPRPHNSLGKRLRLVNLCGTPGHRIRGPPISI